ncbi:MAG: VWA domain-containing protein [Acidobacteria bacterium]|nr:VWA domain-containing protein [Acidobacteriota bacterium]
MAFPGLSMRKRQGLRALVVTEPPYNQSDIIPPMRISHTPVSLIVAFLLFASATNGQEVKLITTVVDQKTGEPVTDLDARSFSVVDGKTPLRVDEAVFKTTSIDVMLLIDSSLVGEMVGPLAGAFVNELGDKEQMAIVSYHDSADLIQDFTSSKQLLFQSLEQINYGNNPRVLDALYAAIEGGFKSSSGRRIAVVLSAGVEGNSRVTEAEVLRLARQRAVSIFPVYVLGVERGMFRRLSDNSGGADFASRKLKLKPAELSKLVFSVLRGHYELLVSGVSRTGERVEVKIQEGPKAGRKLRASALPLE